MDSHILPKALTRADGLGPGLMQFGEGKVERRSSSWYDNALVTEEGESILAAYDNWAIRMLRKHKLVWSGWGPMTALQDVGLRSIQFDNIQESQRFRLFLLSLLWRAAATKRPEFAEIELSSRDLERLRKMILSGDTKPFGFYPASLTQLSTIGVRHNLTPIAQTKKIPAVGGLQSREEPIFRFYFDGLIVHFSRLPMSKNDFKELGNLLVGQDKSLIITVIPYEESAQDQNLRITVAESMLGRPLFEMPFGPFSPDR